MTSTIGETIWIALGIALNPVAIVNLRGLVLLAAAASVIGQADLSPLGLLLLALFVTLASLAVVAPLLLHLFGGPAASDRLGDIAGWRTTHMGLITGAIMALFGALLLTRNLAGVA